ncbi:DegT/DnrJ/EryC1/StrS family aminotransferase [Desulfocurvibacter africanus]|uniref:DegT/DnrJ/EryC1/StrS aminotransferase n=1 Tax=Desulfocurvibacter africanus subsp. africanus str. Walvis Bay TaxID=690850 RepID=F3YWH8_DESAF|nr:DegT/DnrJ/EryC1/StrS family aminotransferase [Desulfocurvibacter africanus]EGJ49364.1 DegT/DnrJ/EryC1/StrS aminotransferase [Desulfocurvibacter africanus subsp. africanus str. Walvis Bay]
MPIQLFVPTFRVDECLSEIRECLEKGWTGLGFKTVALEEAWCKYTGLPHAHFLSSATVGLHLAIRILKSEYGWQDGDEVISTPLTFVSTNHAIAYENLHVTFADVDEYLCLDPKDVERKITAKTRAIVYVGLGGNTGRWSEIVEIARKHNLKLILDAAHMAGTRLNGEIPGKEADAVVYSFQAVKNLPTADSGMICFRDAAHDERARKLCWLGINKDTYARTSGKGAYKWKYDVEEVGYKYHGNSIMAGIGLVQLKYLDQDNSYRRQLAAWYDTAFKGHEDRVLPVPVAPGCESSRHLYVIEVAARDELLMALNDCEIYPGVHYRDNTEYRMYGYDAATCPNARRLSESILSLPMHLRLGHADVKQVTEVVLKYVKPIN